jgi:hypothetical protein
MSSSITAVSNLASDWLTSAWSDIQANSSNSTGNPLLDELDPNSGSSSSGFTDSDFVTLSDTLSGLSTSQVQGMAQIAAQEALDRIQKEAADKTAANDAASSDAANPVWQNAPLPTSVSAGDSTIDLSGNTLTLPNGTTIDLTTGMPTLDITV